MRAIVVALSVLAALQGARAQDSLPAAPARDSAASAGTVDLFLLLTLDYRPDDVAEGLAAAIRRSARPCERVSDYQVFTRTESMRTLKVKCPGQDVYGLTVWRTGQSMIYGGDGMVRPLDLDDGPVVSIYGTRLHTNGASQTAPAAKQITAAATATNHVVERPNMPIWLVVTIAVNGVLLAFVAAGALLFWRAEGAKANHASANLGGLSSADKDRLMDESREVLPDIFHHP
ncbi:MAG: hypothetical protein D6782_05320, partial [Alphaproteobacteria bacterium]